MNATSVLFYLQIRVITKLRNSEQSYRGKVKTHNYINRQNQSTNRAKRDFRNIQQLTCEQYIK